MKKICLILSLVIIAGSFNVMADSRLSLELGSAESVYNKVRIPGDEGTRFNLAPALDSHLYHRLSFSHTFNSPHGVRLLYAPLTFTGDKTFSQDIDFNGVTFSKNSKTDALYQFNSYRASYFYEIAKSENMLLRLGGTLKVRDAQIKLKQNGISKAKKNTGLVPLFYLYSEYQWSNGIKVAFDFDGLVAPQGRAFDMALMSGYVFNDSYALNLGVRMLEGGADNDKVYNFSQVNYYFTSFEYLF